MAWVILFVAGLFECGWAIGLKLSEGFTRFGPSAFTAVALVVTFWLLTWALRSLPVGTAYAVWTGIGATGTAMRLLATVLDGVRPRCRDAEGPRQRNKTAELALCRRQHRLGYGSPAESRWPKVAMPEVLQVTTVRLDG